MVMQENVLILGKYMRKHLASNLLSNDSGKKYSVDTQPEIEIEMKAGRER